MGARCAPDRLRLSELRSRIDQQLVRLLPDYDERGDLTQDCLIKAWQRQGSFRGEAKFTSWLYRVVRNEFVSWLRRSEAAAKAERQTVDPEHPDLGETVLSRIAAERLLENMGATDRSICELRYFDGRASAAVGIQLGLPPGSVRCRTSRLARSFRQSLRSS